MTSTSRCPLCVGDGIPLGTLGCLRWFRCRDYGMTYHRQTGKRSKTRSTLTQKEGDPHGKHFRDMPENTG